MATKAKKKAAVRIDPALARLVDELYATRAARYLLQQQAARKKEREGEIRKALIVALPKFGATGLAGKLARAQLESEPIFVVEDWAKFYKYVQKTGEFELLQRRLAEGALAERAEDVAKEFGAQPIVQEIIAFIRAGGKRSLCTPKDAAEA